MAGDESGAGITSGGGYSGLFPALPFMHKAIRGYLRQQSRDTSGPEAIIAQTSVMWPAFNASGTLMRGYPDISALAARIPIVLRGGGGVGQDDGCRHVSLHPHRRRVHRDDERHAATGWVAQAR